jgi:hypothetical protein
MDNGSFLDWSRSLRRTAQTGVQVIERLGLSKTPFFDDDELASLWAAKVHLREASEFFARAAPHEVLVRAVAEAGFLGPDFLEFSANTIGLRGGECVLLRAELTEIYATEARALMPRPEPAGVAANVIVRFGRAQNHVWVDRAAIVGVEHKPSPVLALPRR